MQEMCIWSLVGGNSLEEDMAIHSSVFTWEIPWHSSLAGYSPWDCKELDMAEWLDTNSITCIIQAADHGCSIHSTYIYWRPTMCQALFQTLMLGHWAKMTKLCLHPAPPLQHGAYILGLGRESDYIATYTSKTCSDFRVLSAGNYLQNGSVRSMADPLNWSEKWLFDCCKLFVFKKHTEKQAFMVLKNCSKCRQQTEKQLFKKIY